MSKSDKIREAMSLIGSGAKLPWPVEYQEEYDTVKTALTHLLACVEERGAYMPINIPQYTYSIHERMKMWEEKSLHKAIWVSIKDDILVALTGQQEPPSQTILTQFMEE